MIVALHYHTTRPTLSADSFPKVLVIGLIFGVLQCRGVEFSDLDFSHPFPGFLHWRPVADTSATITGLVPDLVHPLLLGKVSTPQMHTAAL